MLNNCSASLALVGLYEILTLANAKHARILLFIWLDTTKLGCFTRMLLVFTGVQLTDRRNLEILSVEHIFVQS